MGADPAVRVSVPTEWAEVAGAALMDLLGPYQEVEEAGQSHLVFYPFRYEAGYVSDERAAGCASRRRRAAEPGGHRARAGARGMGRGMEETTSAR